MDNVHIVVLDCHHCQGEHLHEITYAGRLRWAYIADVEHRVRTKPRRMLRRVIRHPVSFALDLPGALLVKPAKMEAELRVLYGRR
jgi:hypothetical protein